MLLLYFYDKQTLFHCLSLSSLLDLYICLPSLLCFLRRLQHFSLLLEMLIKIYFFYLPLLLALLHVYLLPSIVSISKSPTLCFLSTMLSLSLIIVLSGILPLLSTFPYLLLYLLLALRKFFYKPPPCFLSSSMY